MAQVRGFWHQLETATNERQRALLRQLNGQLEGLSRAIEVLLRSLTSIARPRPEFTPSVTWSGSSGTSRSKTAAAAVAAAAQLTLRLDSAAAALRQLALTSFVALIVPSEHAGPVSGAGGGVGAAVGAPGAGGPAAAAADGAGVSRLPAAPVRRGCAHCSGSGRLKCSGRWNMSEYSALLLIKQSGAFSSVTGLHVATSMDDRVVDICCRHHTEGGGQGALA